MSETHNRQVQYLSDDPALKLAVAQPKRQLSQWALVFTEGAAKVIYSRYWRNRQTLCVRKRQTDDRLNKSSLFFEGKYPR